MHHIPPSPPENQNEPHYGGLTRSDIQEFRRLMKETTRLELTEPEAWARAHELVSLYRMFISSLPEDPRTKALDPKPVQLAPSVEQDPPATKPTVASRPSQLQLPF